MADYDEARKLDPAFAEARFHRALARLARNEPDQALADYKDLIRYDPRTPEGYKDWGTAEGRERRSQAVDRLEAALQAAKAEALAHSQKGTALHKEKKLDEAIAEYDKALEWYPRYAEVYYNRGLAYRQKDDLPTAIANYTQAVRLEPKYVAAYANRGFAYYKQGQLDRVLMDFDRILELDPANADARKSKEVIEGMRAEASRSYCGSGVGRKRRYSAEVPRRSGTEK